MRIGNKQANFQNIIMIDFRISIFFVENVFNNHRTCPLASDWTILQCSASISVLAVLERRLNNLNLMRKNYNSTRSQNLTAQTRPHHTSLERNQPCDASLKAPENSQGQFRSYQLPKANIMQAVSIVQWRCQTSLPILRVARFQVTPLPAQNQQKHTLCNPSPVLLSRPSSPIPLNSSSKVSEFLRAHPEVSSYELRVQGQGVRMRLSEVGLIPFSQALYLLREMLIGFEALFDIFGAFEPGEDLIGVGTDNQWRMWIDHDFCSSLKRESSITEKEFIYRVVVMTEEHSLQTVQSRLFFGAAKQFTYSADCSFIKMLEKLKSFIDTNRIFIPSKVNIVLGEGHQQNVRNPLKKLVSQTSLQRETSFKKRKDSSQSFTFYGYSSANLMKRPSVNRVPLSSFPSCAFLKQESFEQVRGIASLPLIGGNATFQASCEKWASNQQINHKSSLSSIRLNPPSKKFPKDPPTLLNQGRSQAVLSNSRHPALVSVQSTPAFNLTRPRHSKKEQIERVQRVPNPVSQLNQPPKRANIRKYSQQLAKMRSVEVFGHKKIQASTIYRNDPPEEQYLEEKWSNLMIEVDFEPTQEIKPSRGDTGHASSSSQGRIPSSSNNSSSTKEIGTSEMEEAYRSLKIQDLAPHRRNNQSHIQHHLPDAHSKNMTISYQFKREDPPSDSESEQGSPSPPQWVNKISDLFSDTVSIKQLKGSIRFKGQQEEPFEKEHLKDVKLDMLEKFGRSVTLHVEEDDAPPRTKHNHYKSMQLIQEELEEVKSFQDEERKEDDMTIKSIRSRRQTQVDRIDKNRQISFKDEFLPKEEEEDGFNFETQMYTIRAHKPQ